MYFQAKPLPDETLLSIFAHFLPPIRSSPNLDTLVRLSTVSKRFRRILLPVIYATVNYKHVPPPPPPKPSVKKKSVDLSALLAQMGPGWQVVSSGEAESEDSIRQLDDEPAHVELPPWMDLDVKDERRFRCLLRTLLGNSELSSLVRSFRCEAGVKGTGLSMLLQAATAVCTGVEEIVISSAQERWEPPSSPQGEDRPFFPQSLRRLVCHAVPAEGAKEFLRCLTSLPHLEELSLSIGNDLVWQGSFLPDLPPLQRLELRNVLPFDVFSRTFYSSTSTLTTLFIHLTTRYYDLSSFTSLRNLTLIHGHRPAAIDTLSTCPPTVEHIAIAENDITYVVDEADEPFDTFAAILSYLPSTLTSLDLPFPLARAARRGMGYKYEDERETFLLTIRERDWLPRLRKVGMSVEQEFTKWGRMVTLGEWKVAVREACEERGVEVEMREDGGWLEVRRREERGEVDEELQVKSKEETSRP